MGNEVVNTSNEPITSTETEPEVEEVKGEVVEPTEEIDETEKPQGFYREEDVPEELRGKYHEMNKAFTESRQEIADLKRKATDLDEIMAEVNRREETVEEPEAGTGGELPPVEDFLLLSPEEQKARVKEWVKGQYEEEDYPRRLERAEGELKAIEADPLYTGLLEKHAPDIQRVFREFPEVRDLPDATRFTLQALAFKDAIQQGKNIAYAEMKKKKGTQVETGGSSSASVGEDETIKTFEDAYRVAGEQLKRKK